MLRDERPWVILTRRDGEPADTIGWDDEQAEWWDDLTSGPVVEWPAEGSQVTRKAS